MASVLGAEETDAEQQRGPIVLDGIKEFTLTQRVTLPLPHFSEKILITLDDITRGQVMTSLSWKSGDPIVINRSLRENDEIAFDAGERSYKLKLVRLKNYLAGNDVAEFKLWEDTKENNDLVQEREKIAMLIAYLTNTDATFIRNGKEYAGKEAGEHIQRKYDVSKDEIQTADAFIEHVASKSSVSQKPYMIRMPDGTEVTTEKWLGEMLAIIEEAIDEQGAGDE